jgi:hypothetical protein
VAVWSKARVCDCSLARILGSNPAGGMDVFSCECCVLSCAGLCYGSTPLQSFPTECGVSEYDLETSTTRRSRPTRAVNP